MKINGFIKGGSTERQNQGLAWTLRKYLYLRGGTLNKSQLRRHKKRDEEFGNKEVKQWIAHVVNSAECEEGAGASHSRRGTGVGADPHCSRSPVVKR